MKKLMLIALVVLLVVAAAGGAMFWWMGQPMYEVGQARESVVQLKAGDLSPAQVAPSVQLHTFEKGEGPLAIVVHGGPGAAPSGPWPGLDGLAETHRVLYYHQRGSGDSTRIPLKLDGGYMENAERVVAAYGMHEQVADIERLRQLAGAEKVTLVGHSFGGLIATLYAAEFPERIERMMLLAPAALLHFPNDEDLFGRVRELLPEERRPAFEAFLERYLDFSAALFDKSDDELRALQEEFGGFYAEAVGPKGWELPPLGGKLGGWMVYGLYLSLGMRHDFRPAIEAVSMSAPVTVVHYEDDLQSVGVAQGYVDVFENARLVKMPGMGHFGHIQQPEQFARLLAAD